MQLCLKLLHTVRRVMSAKACCMSDMIVTRGLQIEIQPVMPWVPSKGVHQKILMGFQKFRHNSETCILTFPYYIKKHIQNHEMTQFSGQSYL